MKCRVSTLNSGRLAAVEESGGTSLQVDNQLAPCSASAALLAIRSKAVEEWELNLDPRQRLMKMAVARIKALSLKHTPLRRKVAS